MTVIEKHAVLLAHCGVCGNLSSELADVSYAAPGEDGRPEGRYLRMCRACARSIARVAGSRCHRAEERSTPTLTQTLEPRRRRLG